MPAIYIVSSVSSGCKMVKPLIHLCFYQFANVLSVFIPYLYRQMVCMFPCACDKFILVNLKSFEF